jgi:DNA-binding NarL/FixJ family response regulator
MEATPRQEDILSLIALGRTDKEIASRLGLSVTTIKTHLRRLYRKHGLRSRAEALAKWLAEKSEKSE